MGKYRQHFINQIKNNTLPHAVLFTGSETQEKLEFAESLAQLVLCGEIKNTQACGKCRSCELFNAHNHPDYYLISPEEKSKIITIEQIRHLSTTLAHTAQLNHYQVSIINPAHVMNTAAANALLKTLEEPPGPVMMILISDKPHLLPRTIYSRCQVFNLSLEVKKEFPSPLVGEGGPKPDEGCLYSTLLSSLDAAHNNPKDYNPIDLAKYCLDFPVETVLENLMNIVMNLIKTHPNLNATQFYFNYYDRLLEIKKLSDNNINFNTQSMLEYLLIEWRG